jgi:hypothetical protein
LSTRSWSSHFASHSTKHISYRSVKYQFGKKLNNPLTLWPSFNNSQSFRLSQNLILAVIMKVSPALEVSYCT